MFSNCVLDLASIQRIAQTINTHNGTIHIGYAGDMTDAHILAFNTIKDKGWTVVANGTPYEKMEVTGDDYSTLTDGTRMFQYDTTLTSWENNLTNL